MATDLQRNPPFRAEHLGSLLRPNDLLNTRAKCEDGSIKKEQLTQAEDQSIKWIVDQQTMLGYHAVSDGEYRRHMFWGSFFEELDGFKEIQRPGIDMFRPYMPDIAAFMEEGHGVISSVICIDKIKHTGSSYIQQWEYLKSQLPKDHVAGAKLTLPAPEWYHMRYREGKAYPKSVYANDGEYFADIAKAYQTELQILYDHGLRNVQFDDPNIAYFCSEKMLAGWAQDESNKLSADEQLDAYIKLYNDCISKCPANMHVGVHVCRGNFVNSRHFSEGGYDRVAKKFFQQMNVNTYYLEYDTPRAGGFEPLQHLPKNKNVILGIITSKFPKLEEEDEMRDRVFQAADIIAKGNSEARQEALKRIGISPQCGFASHSGGNALEISDMVKKLELVRKLADSIWPNEP